MTETPRVAIVVRTKDRPDFLRRALESISAQTFTDWEVAVVNDGGDEAVVESLLAELPDSIRPRVRAVHAPQSRGRWVSANAGVLETSAPYLVLHDDDDSWHPEFLRAGVDYLDAHADRSAVVSRIEIIWEESQGEAFVETGREQFQSHLVAPLLSDMLLYNRFVPIGFLYRRALHAELGLYDESLPVVGDWNFNLKVLARGPLEYLGDIPYAYWHQRADASGSAGNSVISASGDHAKYDALIRDAALREHVQEHGPGLVLYLTKFIDQRLVEVEAGVRHEVRQQSALNRIKRKLRR